MKNVWAYITYLTSYFSFSSVNQQLIDGQDTELIAIHNDITVTHVNTPSESSIGKADSGRDFYRSSASLPGWNYPIFAPPTRNPGSLEWDGFTCKYPKMEGWEPCSNATDRGCWLYNNKTGGVYDISTDYENEWPEGILREYTLVIEDGKFNADGFWANDAKLINGSYPGPLIQACWGDLLRIKVINKLKHNGTAMHFHGIRQLNSTHMDGVPGVTQCPIAPDDYFVYEFRVTQYGDSWYHSHYSVQYADGMLGPVTFHGPTSDDWDEPKAPLLMTDWFHNSAFQVIHEQVPGWPTILLNGKGDISKFEYKDKNRRGGSLRVTPNAPIPEKHTLIFQKGKKYLLRLINTSFSTTFSFSIDHHKLTVVGTDFVPVWPNIKKERLQIGIGQRYTVIVEAEPDYSYLRPPLGKDEEIDEFWIRTTTVSCFKLKTLGMPDYDKAGIVRYNRTGSPNKPAIGHLSPITEEWPLERDKNNETIPIPCRDEYGFEPVLRWDDIPEFNPANGINAGNLSYGEELSAHVGGTPEGKERSYPLANWAFIPDAKDGLWNPMQVDYHNPFFLHLPELNKTDWEPKWMIIPANYKADDWVFLALTGMKTRNNSTGFGAAHPIHLHGHDFAVLQTEDGGPNGKTFSPKNFNFSRKNPPRRDVVLLPALGWVVIAFKVDNPGAWICHCHIAFHASEGLGFTINERQRDANNLYPRDIVNDKPHAAVIEANRVCRRWNDFEEDCTRHWPGKDEKHGCWPACHRNNTKYPKEHAYSCPPEWEFKKHVFQDDSGV